MVLISDGNSEIDAVIGYLFRSRAITNDIFIYNVFLSKRAIVMHLTFILRESLPNMNFLIWIPPKSIVRI